jgi:hypothetical protein
MRNIIYFILVFYSLQSYGQEKNSYKISKNTSDTTYIHDLSDKLIVKLFVDNKIDTYKFFYKDLGEYYQITPNVNSKISFSLDYEIFAFAVSLPKKWRLFQTDDEHKGKTKDVSFSFGFFLNKWHQNCAFSDTKGYYLENTADFVPGWREGIDSYEQLPNYRARKFEGTTSYVINGNKFSYRSFLYQTQIQKKSAGSFIPSLSYLYLCQSDGSEEFKEDYYRNVFTVLAVIAYQYNWVISKSFYFSGGANIGGGFRKSNEYYTIDGNEEKHSYTSVSNTLGFNANVNYQNKNFFCGLKVVAFETTAKQDAESSINNTVAYGAVYLGYRFDAPHLISKVYNKIFKKN